MRTIAFPYTNHCVRIYERFAVDLDPSHRFKISLTQYQKFSPTLAQQLLLVIRRVPTLNASNFLRAHRVPC